MSARDSLDPELDKAAASLTPPTDDMLVDVGVRDLRSLVARGVSTAELRSAVNARAASRPLPHTMGGGGLGNFTTLAGLHNAVSIISGLYVPTGPGAWQVPAERRYAFGQSWTSPNGVAVASKGNGDLYAVTRARLAGTNDHSEAGMYIRVPTTNAAYGQVNRLRLEPDIFWSATGTAEMAWEWARFAAGSVTVVCKLWLVSYELNVATGAYDPLPNTSAVNITLAQASMSGGGGSPFTASGHIVAGSFALDCIVSKARNYLLGVVAQTRVFHNLQHGDGPPHQLTEPAPGQFNTYGILDAMVPEMWVSNTILAA